MDTKTALAFRESLTFGLDSFGYRSTRLILWSSRNKSVTVVDGLRCRKTHEHVVQGMCAGGDTETTKNK
jgi:hypothetical protein